MCLFLYSKLKCIPVAHITGMCQAQVYGTHNLQIDMQPLNALAFYMQLYGLV
jgi:hypothetical protein